LHMLRHVTGCH